QWLEPQHLTYDDLWSWGKSELKLEKLKESVARDELEKRFAFRKLDTLELGRIVLRGEAEAVKILSLLREGLSFWLGKTYSEDETTRRQCGYMGIGNAFAKALTFDTN